MRKDLKTVMDKLHRNEVVTYISTAQAVFHDGVARSKNFIKGAAAVTDRCVIFIYQDSDAEITEIAALSGVRRVSCSERGLLKRRIEVQMPSMTVIFSVSYINSEKILHIINETVKR